MNESNSDAALPLSHSPSKLAMNGLHERGLVIAVWWQIGMNIALQCSLGMLLWNIAIIAVLLDSIEVSLNALQSKFSNGDCLEKDRKIQIRRFDRGISHWAMLNALQGCFCKVRSTEDVRCFLQPVFAYSIPRDRHLSDAGKWDRFGARSGSRIEESKRQLNRTKQINHQQGFHG